MLALLLRISSNLLVSSPEGKGEGTDVEYFFHLALTLTYSCYFISLDNLHQQLSLLLKRHITL